MNFEKPWFRSKKFIAFLLMETLLTGMAVLALLTQPGLGWPLSAFMTGLVLTMGAVALVFNGYQAALDKYLRGMALDRGTPAKEEPNGEEEKD